MMKKKKKERRGKEGVPCVVVPFTHLPSSSSFSSFLTRTVVCKSFVALMLLLLLPLLLRAPKEKERERERESERSTVINAKYDKP